MAILAFGRWFVQGGVGFDGYYVTETEHNAVMRMYKWK